MTLRPHDIDPLHYRISGLLPMEWICSTPHTDAHTQGGYLRLSLHVELYRYYQQDGRRR